MYNMLNLIQPAEGYCTEKYYGSAEGLPKDRKEFGEHEAAVLKCLAHLARQNKK